VIVLDTNVVSEAMRGPDADPRVRTWLRSHSSELVTTVITRAEILAGLAVLPSGARRDRLNHAADAAFGMAGAVLPLTDDCPVEFADIVRRRRSRGLAVDQMDALIASICRAHGASIATRNGAHFSHLDLLVTDPWAE
jgi:toxin FitB